MMDEAVEHIRKIVWNIVHQTTAFDLSTCLYDPRFSCCLRADVDSLFCTPDLLAMAFGQLVPEDASRRELADEVFRRLFLEQTPADEARRSVLTSLGLLGVNVAGRDLNAFRSQLDGLSVQECAEKVFTAANIGCIVSEADLFDEAVRSATEYAEPHDRRFRLSLSVDSIITDFKTAAPILKEWGYAVSDRLGKQTYTELLRLLGDWQQRLSPVFVSCNLQNPLDDDAKARKILTKVVIPFCVANQLPLAINGLEPQDALALQKENAELALWARPCGFGEFLDEFPAGMEYLGLCRGLMGPQCTAHCLRESLASVGFGFSAYESDSISLLQLPGRWAHFRWNLGLVLQDFYTDLARTGWMITEDEIRRDVRLLFGADKAAVLGLAGGSGSDN